MQSPSLLIPSYGKRILQTDASDEVWATVLYEEMMENEKSVDTKVVNSSLPNSTTILPSKRSWQFKEEQKSSNLI